MALRDGAPPPAGAADSCPVLPAPTATPDGAGLRVVPSGLAEVVVQRVTVLRSGSVKVATVRRPAAAGHPPPWSAVCATAPTS